MTLLEKKYKDNRKIRKAEEYFQISREYLETSKRIEKLFLDHRMAVYTGFHALNLCVCSLILLKGKRIPRSNTRINSCFGNSYAKSGEASKGLLKDFYWALNKGDEVTNRLNAQINKEDAQKMIRLGKQMQNALGSKLKEAKDKN